jgi:hypothetical protein
MPSKTKESGRADFLLRMPPELKLRLAKAANEDGVTIRDLVLYAIEQMLDTRDAEVAADRKRADLERHLEMKFGELVEALAGGNIAGLKADKLIELEELAEAEIEKWRDYAASDCHAAPRTPRERICKEHDDIETELQRAPPVISTFEDDDEALLDEALFDDGDLDDAESE